MKKIISLLMALSIIVCSFAVGTGSAFAAQKVKYAAQKHQYNAQFSDFNFGPSGNAKVYYSDDYEDSYLTYSGYLAKRGNTIDSVSGYSNNIENLFIYNDYIYYTCDGKIKRCKKDGSSKRTVLSYGENTNASFIIYNKKIYYKLVKYNDDYDIISSKLYSCSLTGKSKKLIASNVMSAFYAYYSKLYFVKGNRLKCYNIKTKKTSNVTSKSMSGKNIINMEGNNLYYYTETGDFEATLKVYSINIKSKKVKKIKTFYSDEPIHSMYVSGTNVYVTSGTGAGDWFAKIKNGQLNGDAYRSKYDTAGSSIPVYRNYVMVANFVYDSYAERELFEGYVKMAKVK